jgi:hypothetical protein
MTLSKAHRQTLKDIAAQIEGGNLDAVPEYGIQIDRITSDIPALSRLLDAAAFQVADIEEADEDEREDYCREAVEAIEAVLVYRKPPVRKANKATGRAGIEIVMTDDTHGFFRF